MIQRLVGLLVAMVIVVTACSGGETDNGPSVPTPMDRKTISHAMDLAIVQRLRNDSLSNPEWRARVDGIIFQVDEVVTPDVTFHCAPRKVGDTVPR